LKKVGLVVSLEDTESVHRSPVAINVSTVDPIRCDIHVAVPDVICPVATHSPGIEKQEERTKNLEPGVKTTIWWSFFIG
jgi:hypothetical protein